MKYYIYTLDKKLQMITAALPCPDEKTGKQAYLLACQHLGWGLDDPRRGVVSIDSNVTIDLDDEEGGQGTIHLQFELSDFEFAESRTKECIASDGVKEWFDQFMQQVNAEFLALDHYNPTAVASSPETDEEGHGNIAKESPNMIESSDSDVANIPHAASGRGIVGSALKSHDAPIEWANEPVEVVVKNEPVEVVVADTLSEQDIFHAQYMAGLALEYASDVDKWHFISETKFNGKGWADIARAELSQQVLAGKRKTFMEKDVENFARNIQYKVEALRQSLGFEQEKNGKQNGKTT